ncbi:MAG TPA: ATP-binding protein [Chitinispirillaceae bacterium]|nr:ATP-binding protein [Chitinispirillaceae bacterium]
MSLKTPQFLTGLLYELCKLPKECEWVEFKYNNSDKEEIGSYISALSNSAALQGKSAAFLIWGIDDKTHEILGTTFDFKSIKVGNEELENWLLQRLNPKIHFQFYNIDVDGKSVIILEIPRAYRHPVSFHQEEFIRVGSYKKKLKEFPDKERELWRTLDITPFETLLAKEQISADEVLSILDYPTYFSLLKIPLPNGHAAILDALLSDEIITTCEAGGYNITNLGAILIARNLDNFSKLRRKAVRIIRYKGAVASKQ